MAHSPVLALQPGSAPAPSVRTLPFMRAAVPIALILLIAVSAVLRFANLSAIGDANLYYTAAVTSMLQSPANFFFAAAEPGGAVTVDKPPVGLWLQTLSAAVFGVSGAAVALPQILASIACVPLIFVLVRRHFGVGAGLIAATVMAVIPIDIATARNNTMDMTLVFTLLLAAWAYLRAAETGRLGWLIAGGVLVGIGFNIKMLQAFLPVPAFFALYLLGARVGWRRKLLHLAVGGAVLLAVSLSWALIVDAIPADQRPYIGSSSTNSVMELIIGYNGISRLLGNNAGGAGVQTGGAPGGGGMFGGEIGDPGVFRLFTGALGNESGWLLPVSLIALCLVIAGARLRLPLLPRHQGAVLWGGWLLTAVIFFSRAEFFHAYYLVMLTPPIAALTGAGLAVIGGWAAARPRLAGLLAAALAGAGVGYQVWLAQSYLGDSASAWLPVLALPVLLAIGAFASALVRARPSLTIALASAALFVIPTAWGVATTASSSPNTMLPSAFGGTGDSGGFPGRAMPVGTLPAGAAASDTMPTFPAGGGLPGGAPGMGGMGMGVDDALLTYLEDNTAETRYLMAVSSSMVGAPYIIATGRPVLYTGGFSGSDPVADADDLAALVAAGELRYVLWTNTRGLPGMMMNIIGGAGGGAAQSDSQRPANMLRAAGGIMGNDAGISAWLTSACTPVEDVLSGLNAFALYDCVGGAS